MSFQQLHDCFIAFNQNALSAIEYEVASNACIILTIISALVITVLNLHYEIQIYTEEEQNII